MNAIFFSTRSIAIFAILFLLASCNKEIILVPEEFPTAITEYVDEHFPEKPILQVVEDNDGFLKTYDVVLEDAITLEFDKDGKVKKIKSKKKLPASVIPTKINDYVTTNYESNDILGWEGKEKSQTIELDNELKLTFNNDGDFVRIDG